MLDTRAELADIELSTNEKWSGQYIGYFF
jgi:hypothetical protein